MKIPELKKLIEQEEISEKEKAILIENYDTPKFRQFFYEWLIKGGRKLDKIDFLLPKLVEQNPNLALKTFEQNYPGNQDFIKEYIKKHFKKFTKNEDGFYFLEDLVLYILKNDKESTELASELLPLLIKDIESNKGERNRSHQLREDSIIGEILFELFKTFKEENELEKIGLLIKTITNTFSLIGDQGQFSLETPPHIFQILKEFILIDFKANFHQVVRSITDEYIKQYVSQKTGETFFDGYEPIGMGISSMNGSYSQSDRHYITKTLRPAVREHFGEKKGELFEFLKEDCLQCKAVNRRISRRKPDFLNRLSIPFLIDFYFEGSERRSTFSYTVLKEFILQRKGIPSKSTLIHQEIKRASTNAIERDKKTKDLLEVSLEKYKVPVDPFVNQLVIDLVSSEDKKISSWATNQVMTWFENEKFLRNNSFEESLHLTIGKFLRNNFKAGLSLFYGVVSSDFFIKEMSQNLDRKKRAIYDYARHLNYILSIDTEKTLEYYKKVLSKSVISPSEQILITSSLSHVGPKEAPLSADIVLEVFQKIIKSSLTKWTKNKELLNKLTIPEARQYLVEFAELLIKYEYVSHAIYIIECFINDPDPILPTDKEDPYNEHARIAKGEGYSAITSVRGWCAWILQSCMNVKGRPYIDKLMELTFTLVKETPTNYYIRHMACFPLSRLAQLRLMNMGPNTGELYLDSDIRKALEKSKMIEKVAVELLEEIINLPQAPQEVLTTNILSVFNYIRALNQHDAKKVVDLFLKLPESSIVEIVPLLIYFALYRTGDYKDWEWKADGLYEDLEPFDNTYFLEQMEKWMNSENEEIREKFSWQFYILASNKIKRKRTRSTKKDFEIALGYMKKLLKNKPTRKIYGNTFRFINEYMDQYFDECYDLFKVWLKSVKTNCSLTDLGYQQYDSLAIKIFDSGSEEDFLSMLHELLELSEGNFFGRLDTVVEKLSTIPNENPKAQAVFEKLVTIAPRYIEPREEWLEK